MILLNDKRIDFKPFGNGEVEPHAQTILSHTSLTHVNVITFKYENDADLLHLEFVKDFIDEFISEAVVTLRIAYMPYSRMDRTEGSKVFTLKTIAKRINQMKFQTVTVYEPHSDVTLALLDRVKPIHLTKLILPGALDGVGFDIKKDYLCYPDAGAQKRYSMPGFKYVVANKLRDWDTGHIKSLEIVGDIEEGAKVIIIDDLCSYGRTFVMTGEALKAKGASEVHLVVAHAEQGLFAGRVLKEKIIDTVYTSDTIISAVAPELTMCPGRVLVKRIIGEGI